MDPAWLQIVSNVTIFLGGVGMIFFVGARTFNNLTRNGRLPPDRQMVQEIQRLTEVTKAGTETLEKAIVRGNAALEKNQDDMLRRLEGQGRAMERVETRQKDGIGNRAPRNIPGEQP